ncbi:MAG: hypothetical protein QOD11_372 [Bradyrhizobium sp.]|jgi:hypothetical protein|nr:hypothetical protein [Bradyrhizobium sp.]
MFKKVIGWSVVTILAAAVILTYLPTFVADSLYKNVDDISDGEMPPTITSFQSGPEVVSIIGGSGEGLNCSLPSLANAFFDGSQDSNGRRHLVLQRFRQACVFHDLCYRHGLATYGYNQNDCDRTLQNEAFRLCLYIRNGSAESNAARCQTDSKMVLAGVGIGGYGAYRAWDRSTYFEFESDPSRSNGFLVSRVVDHPFKSVDPDKYLNESDQVILTFENIRSNLAVTCVTCAKQPVFRPVRNPNDVSLELRSIGITKLPEALVGRDDQMLSQTGPVWLPPRRRHAAPHLLVDSTGKNHLIWMSRNNLESSISCIVVTDAARLLTTTLPRRDVCDASAGSPLSMVEVDMFATSPLPMEVPGAEDRIFTTAISPQKKVDRSLSFCSRSAVRAINRRTKGLKDDQAKCDTFSEVELAKGAGLGAFQSFAVVRAGQQIYFARDIDQREDSPWTKAWQRIWGDTYSPGGAMLAVDILPPVTANGPAVPKLKKIVRFNIDDRFDPMLPITQKNDDLRFLSLEASGSSVHVRMIDFAKDAPAVGNVRLTMNGSDIDLHRSWALRPMLVLETKDAQPKTRLVFSRAEIVTGPDQPVQPAANTEALSLETLVFERDAAAAADTPFLKTGGAACTVTYTFKPNGDYPCTRAFDPKRPMRSSLAAKMQASQLLVGHFAGPDGHGIAFPDYCLKAEPVILKPQGDTFVAPSEPAGKGLRKVTCEPLNATADVSGPIKHRAAAGKPPAG